ncbi:MAG: T9SS type A sorting domain-containing protein [bacterium]|nr:T9SS type A sorting domain-containing protein [bacterium]
MVNKKVCLIISIGLLISSISSLATAQQLNSVMTWGSNEYAQLGNESGFSREYADTVEGTSGAVSISGGGMHCLVALSNGTIKAWGTNSSGQVGNGTTDDVLSPDSVVGISSAVKVYAGYMHSIALLSDSTIMAWGSNNSGQLGNGTTVDTSIPVLVNGLNSVVAIAVGELHSLALLADGTIKAWGDNTYGQLGQGTIDSAGIDTPVTVLGISNAIAIAAGDRHSLALLADNTIQAWGWNAGGQLGIGTTKDTSLPATVTGITNAVKIAAGGKHSFAILANETIKAWGDNTYGQLGIGAAYLSSDTAVIVPGINNALEVDGGWHHSLALLSDGTMKAWGDNTYGQLGGNEIIGERDTPVVVVRVENGIAIAAGDEHSMALGIMNAVEEKNVVCKCIGVSLASSMVNNNIELLTTARQKLDYKVFDVCGRVMLSGNNMIVKGKLNINASQLKQGVYFITVKTLTGNTQFKLVKVL